MSNKVIKIESIDLFKYSIPWKYPLIINLGVFSHADNVVVRINTDAGISGFGEASPFGPITGGTQDTNFEAGKQIAGLIKGKNVLDIESLMFEINQVIVGQPSIKAAFDMALYDISGKNAGVPVYTLLSGKRRTLQTDLTIGITESVDETVRRAKRLLDLGFDAIKMKVGRQQFLDIPHVRAVRELAGSAVPIRIDANQGWSFSDAVINLSRMEKLDIQYCEQPIAAWDIDNLRSLRRKTDIPICADESVFDHHDAFKLVSASAVDFLNIKLMKSGGIHTGLKINAVGEASGCKCMIGCFSESRLGLTAAAHLASACGNIHFIDLDTAFDLEEDPVIGGMTYGNGGLVTVPDSPGLGASIDEDFLKKAVHAEI